MRGCGVGVLQRQRCGFLREERRARRRWLEKKTFDAAVPELNEQARTLEKGSNRTL